jgi:hypothetical protein
MYYSGGPNISFHQLVSRLYFILDLLAILTDSGTDPLPSMLGSVPPDRVRDVFERFRSPGDDHVALGARHDRDGERDELALGDRVAAYDAGLGEPDARGGYRVEHGVALYDSLRSLFLCEFGGSKSRNVCG